MSEGAGQSESAVKVGGARRRPSGVAAVVCLAAALWASSAAAQEVEEAEEREITFTVDEVEEDGQPLVSAEIGLAAGQRPEVRGDDPDRYVLKPPSEELSFVGVFFARGTATNIAITNPLRTGLVVGRLFGSNESTTVDERSYYAEQRLIGFLTYAPKLLNQRARLRAAFEVDFIYGDASNGAGANVGGAINGDQVNLQTKRLAVEVGLLDDWYAVIGLQALTDNVHDPHYADPYIMLHSGYHLAFWGTDAAGAAVYGKAGGWLKVKAAAYSLWENVPHEDDDVWLAQLDVSTRPGGDWWVGASAWYLSEKSNGRSGFGLRSQVAQANGAGVLLQEDFDYDYTADITWLGVNVQRNVWFKTDRLALDGFAIMNIGSIEKRDPETGRVLQEADVMGYAALGEVAYRFGRTRNDVASLEVMTSSGDFDLDDARYGTVATGQLYGVPGAAFGSPRLLLLMPDLRVVNRQVAAVGDLSNGGYGLMAGVANLQYDLIANRLTGKLGMGSAFSAVDVPSTGARYIGTEMNAELYVALDSLLIVGFHGGYLFLGDFYDSPEVVFTPDGEVFGGRPEDPWVAYASLTWVAF